MEELQRRLDRLLPGREPLDLEMIDGYLCGVLLQPRAIPEVRWLAHVLDVEGRPAPKDFDVPGVRALLRRRYDELAAAISDRDGFDPWIYGDDEADPSETVMPWVAGFATAVDTFTELMDRHEPELTEPLAGLYRHLDPDDMEDAEALLEEIETLEPPAELAEAVEDLVRGTLLIADVVHPLADEAGGGGGGGGGRRRPGKGRGPGQGGGRSGGAGGDGGARSPGARGGGRGGPGPGPRSKNGRP
jgi:uncharacterized protein